MSLPHALSAALSGLLEGVSRKDLAARADKISAAYRAGQSSGGIRDEADALAYALARMPATGAALGAVFARLAEVAPGFSPRSLLDAGAGPGTASWMAVETFPTISAVTMLDHNAPLQGLARKLAGAGAPVLAGADIHSGDLSIAQVSADLVVASYVLVELPEERAAATAKALWQRAQGTLVLVEPGTPQGFARIRAARAGLVAQGAHVAAPCTHDQACPLTGDDWCHFSQRLARSRDHMLLKEARVPFEDERYAYVVLMREPVVRQTARILSLPLEAKPGITLKLCDGAGLRAQFIPVRDKDAYRRARRAGWGDLF
jgi:ribosomal protein RSM22 (predicted rRNA methylase)